MKGVLTGLLVALVVGGAFAGLANADDHDTLIDYEGENLTLHSGPGQTVTGQTDLEPGTVVEVRIESVSAEYPYLTREEVPVTENGSFTAHFDLSELDPRAKVTVTVTADASVGELTEIPAEVYPCNGGCPESTKDNDPPEHDWNVSSVDASEWTGDGLDLREGTSVVQGETGIIPVSLGDASTANLSIGNQAQGYEVNATLRDGDGDGRVDVRFNTTAAGQVGKTVRSVDEDDSVTVTKEQPPLPGFIDSGEYDVDLAGGPNGTGDHVDATLVIEKGNITNSAERDLYTPVGPTPLDFAEGRDIFTGYSGEVVPINLTLPEGETVTLAIGGGEANYSVEAVLRDRNGDGRLGIVFDTAVGVSDDPIELRTDGDLVVDVREDGANVSGVLPPDENYDVEVYRKEAAIDEERIVGTVVLRSFGGPDANHGDGPPGETDERKWNTTIRHEGETLSLSAAPGQTITGRTDLPAGTPLELRLKSTSATQPFLTRLPATVRENGTFEATVDLSPIDEAGTMVLAVYADSGERLTSVDVRVDGCADICSTESSNADVRESGGDERGGGLLSFLEWLLRSLLAVGFAATVNP